MALTCVPVTASLEDALAAMMRSDTPLVAVTDDGRTGGALTPASVHRALRRLVADDAPKPSS